jgi:hypothetical protein
VLIHLKFAGIITCIFNYQYSTLSQYAKVRLFPKNRIYLDVSCIPSIHTLAYPEIRMWLITRIFLNGKTICLYHLGCILIEDFHGFPQLLQMNV